MIRITWIELGNAIFVGL